MKKQCQERPHEKELELAVLLRQQLWVCRILLSLINLAVLVILVLILNFDPAKITTFDIAVTVFIVALLAIVSSILAKSHLI